MTTAARIEHNQPKTLPPGEPVGKLHIIDAMKGSFFLGNQIQLAGVAMAKIVKDMIVRPLQFRLDTGGRFIV